LKSNSRTPSPARYPSKLLKYAGAPKGTRTPVSAVRGRMRLVDRQPSLDHRLRLRVAREPKRSCDSVRIEPEFLPPPGFITVPMQLAMMSPAERHGEFVADLTTECTGLREAQMVWIARLPTADQARLLNHMPDVIAVTHAARFGEDKNTLVYLRCRTGFLGRDLHREHIVALCILCLDHRQLSGKCLLHLLCVGFTQSTLRRQLSMRPQCCIVRRAEVFDLAEQFSSQAR